MRTHRFRQELDKLEQIDEPNAQAGVACIGPRSKPDGSVAIDALLRVLERWLTRPS